MQTQNQQKLELDGRKEITRHLEDVDSKRTVLSVIIGLLSSVISLVVGAASASSWISSIDIRSRQVGFLVGVLAFQSLFLLIFWMLRKRNRSVVKVSESLIKTYLSAINQSSLNPNYTSSQR